MSDDMRPDIAAAWANVSNKVGKKRDVRKLPEYLNGGRRSLPWRAAWSGATTAF